MDSLPDLVVLAALFGIVFLSLRIGLRKGRRVPRDRVPEHEHLGTIQGAILGLLGLLLGFSFAGAMNRFIERQDALFAEADAISNAYDRAELLPTADRVRDRLREYAALRLELFHNQNGPEAADLTERLAVRLEAARHATYEGARQSPQFALLAISGVEAIGNEFARRSAIHRRHLPTEMVVVLILCSAIAIGTIGYGVGLAERRSTGSATALAALVAITLFVTLDFDRPRRGFISLSPAPLEELIRTLHEHAPDHRSPLPTPAP